MKLFIVESPAKARKIRTFLGSGYKVEASIGHIREIPRKGLNVDVKNGFTPNFVISSGKKDVVKKIKDLAKKADTIYLATDPDREGEAIAWHIYDLLDQKSKKKCKRSTYHEIKKAAILKSIDEAREIDWNKVNSQKARQVLDRLIGYKVSPVLWFSVGKGTSAGRVQSIALKLICDRQKEIDAFKPVTYWYVDGLLKGKNGSFWGRVIVPKTKDNRFLDKKKAEKAHDGIKSSTFTVGEVEKNEKKLNPYPPFDTNSLQQAASAIFKWKAKKTMKTAQSLYEGGFVSYIRSDSFAISEEALDEVRAMIRNDIGNDYLPTKANTYKKKGKVASQEAHECIRPTHIEDEGNSLYGDEKKLYSLIRDRFIACQMKPMIFNVSKYLVDASCGEQLITTGQVVTFDGFSKVWKYTKANEEALPEVTKGEKLQLEDSKMSEHTTKPPDRFNDGSLVKKMEKDGVGRPSTWASIISTLEDKKYIKHEKSALVPLPIGMKISDFLSPAFKDFFMDISFTASLENQLDQIESGEKDFLEVVSAVYEQLKKELKNAKAQKVDKSTGEKCSKCKKHDIVVRFSRFGEFYACEDYKNCKTIFDKTEEGFVPRKKKKAAKKVGRDCPKCKKPLVERTSSYGKFVACSGYPKCRFKEKNE